MNLAVSGNISIRPQGNHPWIHRYCSLVYRCTCGGSAPEAVSRGADSKLAAVLHAVVGHGSTHQNFLRHRLPDGGSLNLLAALFLVSQISHLIDHLVKALASLLCHLRLPFNQIRGVALLCLEARFLLNGFPGNAVCLDLHVHAVLQLRIHSGHHSVLLVQLHLPASEKLGDGISDCLVLGGFAVNCNGDILDAVLKHNIDARQPQIDCNGHSENSEELLILNDFLQRQTVFNFLL